MAPRAKAASCRTLARSSLSEFISAGTAAVALPPSSGRVRAAAPRISAFSSLNMLVSAETASVFSGSIMAKALGSRYANLFVLVLERLPKGGNGWFGLGTQ